MTNDKAKKFIHTIESEANSIFDDALISYADSLPEKKKRPFLVSIFGEYDNGRPIRESATDLSGMLSRVINSVKSIGEIKEPTPPTPLLKNTMQTCVFCWNALHENALGHSNEAWLSLVQAGRCCGRVEGASPDAKNMNFSDAAALLARMRHSENYQLADDALKFWKEKISPVLSAQKAADELIKVVPLGHKKLAELVSAEKKKVSRLRTPEPERKA